MEPIIYRIDNDDIIYSIEGSWDEFALENDGYPENRSENILGNSLWTYIKDFETKHLYKLIIDHIRLLQQEITIPIRCDSPTMIRFIDLKIIPLDASKIEFIGEVKKEVKRNKVDILDKHIPRNEDFIKMCSYCKSIKVDENHWLETTEAVIQLNLFNKPVLPKISHGACPECYNKIIEELKNYRLAFNKTI